MKLKPEAVVLQRDFSASWTRDEVEVVVLQRDVGASRTRAFLEHLELGTSRK